MPLIGTPATRSFFGTLALGLFLSSCGSETRKDVPLAEVAPRVPAPTVRLVVLEDTALAITWSPAVDDRTLATDLEYAVVVLPGAVDASKARRALAKPSSDTKVVAWKRALSRAEVAELAPETEYTVHVTVRDAEGNAAGYKPLSVTTKRTAPEATPTPAPDTTSPDATPPQVPAGTAISFSSATTNSLRVSWPQATDNVTSTNALQYKLVRASEISAIDSIAEIAAGVGVTVVADWSTALTQADATGLGEATRYAFALLVRDAAGNTYLLGPTEGVTQDLTPPDLAAPVLETSDENLYISFEPALDNLTPRDGLLYSLVVSDSSLDVALARMKALEADSTSCQSTCRMFANREPGSDVFGQAISVAYFWGAIDRSKVYHVGILVRDAAGNERHLTTRRRGGLRVFVTDASYDGNLGGPSGADEKCMSDNDRPVGNATFKALVMTSSTSMARRDPTHSWVLVPYATYVRADDSIVTTTGRDALFEWPFPNTIQDPARDFWHGLERDNLDWVPTETCSNWTSNSSTFTGRGGRFNTNSDDFFEGFTTTCNDSRRLLCIEQP